MHSIGICTSIANGALAAKAGADFVEEHVQHFLQPDQPEFHFQPGSLPVQAANYFLPVTLKCVGPVVEMDRLVRHAEIVFQRARQAGIAIIVLGSAGSRQIPDGFPKAQAESQFLALLRELGPLAARQGIVVVVEPINREECNFIQSVPEAAAFVEACGHPHIQLLADLYHMLREGQPPDDLLPNGALLRHVHLAEKLRRTPPGVAGDDFRPFFKALRRVNYQGALCVEAIWHDFPAEAGPAVAEVRRQVNES